MISRINKYYFPKKQKAVGGCNGVVVLSLEQQLHF
jgi:hypothetical protein